MTPEFTPTAPNRTVNLDAQLDPESELTSVTSSDDSEGGTDTDGNIHLVQDTANEKLVQVYENPTSNGKHMKIYHPRINTRNTANVNVSDHSNLAAVMATGIPAKKRKYEIADFSHAASQYILQPQASEFESVRFGRQGLPLSTSVSDMPANRFRRVRESEERSKLKGTVSATRNEIALPLDTIYGPMTPASANSNPWPSATHPMTLGHSRTNYQPGENVHKPIYLSMQAPPRPTIALKSPATRKSRIQGYQSELSSLVDTSYTSSLTTSKEAWTWENIRSTARAAIPHETRNIKNGRIAATLDGDQQSSIDTTVIDSQRIENTNILSEHARLPFLAANRDMAGQKIRPQHTASLNSANSMAESPSEGMVLDGDESRSVQT
ncbi:hypothetical protein QFC19_002635 [Naganishia cerealis]|uniref:Uncharacterized protein n=1 Tax=Naganishia cerealis TaxID=610337 RepID=A0ACC2W9X6_9TREE|nr:hypothetical protein QFC19_002635 [Naganishia cerealis]